ncbi:unnamed protein product [Rotaria sordida]|uniref:F-box domain-containing protein n=1 Tax=Rotaria sordida TaxID=392033 RepID=A0A816D6G1_9BILA|nr:unnamed protein product [Rotaria sordida]CAF1633162.1 unnamed protein product [Rotaria sordida]
MEYLSVHLNDLSDKILIYILKKLSNIDVLYSLFGVNKRLNKIVCNSIFTNHLTLLKSSLNYCVLSLSDRILDRFCVQILPEIHNKIKWLDLEPFSMERILLAVNYPNLYGFGLYNIQEEKAIYLFNDESLFTRMFKNQVSSLVISINANGSLSSREDVYAQLSFGISSPNVFSSTLLELHVCLSHFTDCLYLLDGRFNELRILHVNINFISSSNLTIDNQKKLPNLRSFSLHCNRDTYVYDELIVPLLYRMSDLEKLDLSLIISGKGTFVDGNDLKTNIINKMPFLNKFTFNIRSFSHFYNQINIPSNEDIQHTLNDYKDNQIISCVDYFPNRNSSQGHIYSYPYKLKHYDNITNNFSGGIFKCVREVSSFDERSFEHEFFLRIAESFPLMEKLTLINMKPQINKFYQQSKNDHQHLSIVIKYSHLTDLNLTKIDEDYPEQFLLDTKMSLPNGIFLQTDYQLLNSVTHNFTRNETRQNCAKLKIIFFINKSEFPEHLKDYFPCAKIL